MSEVVAWKPNGAIVLRWREGDLYDRKLEFVGKGKFTIPDGGPVVHPTIDAAINEAKRLASENGGTFYVFSAVACAKPTRPPVEIIRIETPEAPKIGGAE